MAIIKSYTDIEQSKKLANILPLESADMYYACGTIAPPDIMIGNKQDYRCYTRCWSLAALLDVLPKIHGLKPIVDLEETSIQYSGIDLYVIGNNPVDACVAMIEKLHELKML